MVIFSDGPIDGPLLVKEVRLLDVISAAALPASKLEGGGKSHDHALGSVADDGVDDADRCAGVYGLLLDNVRGMVAGTGAVSEFLLAEF